MTCKIEARLETLDRIRERSNDRWLDQRERLEAKAEPLVGELVREGTTIFYINQLTANGDFTGRTVEFARQYDAIEYLIRNRYV
jgi:hypothetical protein